MESKCVTLQFEILKCRPIDINKDGNLSTHQEHNYVQMVKCAKLKSIRIRICILKYCRYFNF